MIAFSLAIFLSAFLLFQVQPIIARFILPAFGGTPAVWTACMMFFQVALLCGYLYAHLVATRVPSGRQPMVHLGLLLLSILLLPIGPPDTWAPTATGEPAIQILGLLALSVGVPFVLISASAPLLQHWFSGAHPGKSPFRLYALSNFGSLVALLSYPTLFEPALTIRNQSNTWSVLYVALAGLFVVCGLAYARSGAGIEAKDSNAAKDRPVTALDRVLWIALAAAGSTMLLAMTNHICQDVAVVPFLWILPLSLYLITFIISFDKDAWYHRGVWMGLMGLSLIPMLQLMFNEYSSDSASLRYQVAVFCTVLFACCMVCHGELARRRSAVPHLTTFYLYVALGGALGGVFVNLVAPIIFKGFFELHVALAATFILAGVCLALDGKLLRSSGGRAKFSAAWGLASVGLVVMLVMQVQAGRGETIHVQRSFFGVMLVDESDVDTEDHERSLYHGKIQHGRQLLANNRNQRWPTAYYGVNSGVGQALMYHPRRRATNPDDRGMNIAVVGLGVGTLSTYGKAGDRIRYYEINPDVEAIAREHFTYLGSSNAEVDVVLGDARISMERELQDSGSNDFDVLVVDAFSGDSIPVHLLTEEAFDLYAKHLKNDGILALHITNLYVDLKDVVRNAAERLGKEAVWIEEYSENWYEDDNDWVLIGNNPQFLRSRRIRTMRTEWPTTEPAPIRWTDDFSNLFEVLDWN